MDPKSFIKGRSRETEIKRNASGKWFLGEDPISHPNLVESFNQWVDVAEDGRYCLKNDINWAYIEILGAPYIVRGVRFQKDESCTLLLAGNLEETLEPATLRQDKQGQLYCSVKQGRLTAQLDRYAASQLAENLHEDEKGIFLMVAGQKWRPPVVDEPLFEKKTKNRESKE